MSLSSFRALLLALAMVFQTVAGGWSVAFAASTAAGIAPSHHCEKMGAPSDRAGDARHGPPRHMCESCLLCAAPLTCPLPDVDGGLAASQTFARVGFRQVDSAGRRVRLTYAWRARGPPAGDLFA